MIILVCSVLGFSTLGCILAVLACLCFASKKKTGENNNDLSVASLNNSNSYIHYNSPRFGAGAKHNKRRTSASSGLTQSTASFRSLMINKVRERIDEDCLELCKKPEQSEKVPPAPAPVSPPLIMSLFSPINNPYSRLMAAMAEMSHPKPPVSATTGQPLDLSKAPEEKEIDVVSTDEESEEIISPRDWDCKQVRSFIKSLQGCEDFAEMFEAEKISGSRLVSLSVPQLVQCLGIPLAQSIRIISIVRKLDN